MNVCDTSDPVDPVGGIDARGDGTNGMTAFFWSRANLIHAGGMLVSRESISPKCQGAMAALGVDFDVLADAASNVDIKDAINDSDSIASAFGNAQLGASAQSQYDKDYAGYLQAHGETHMTIGDYFAANPGVQAWTPFLGNTVYINPSTLPTSNFNVDQGLMLHEMLHEVYGLDDQGIMKTLKAYDPGAGINTSQRYLKF